jgi:hypothetical protein
VKVPVIEGDECPLSPRHPNFFKKGRGGLYGDLGSPEHRHGFHVGPPLL